MWKQTEQTEGGGEVIADSRNAKCKGATAQCEAHIGDLYALHIGSCLEMCEIL